ncbi:hypothetical protein YTPLAS21_02420 [Candidatus Nitrosocosmicus sp.]|jgi:hypothetical protein|uniref:hypothetical protein n=1 Tax=Candidatus Nitrosocosmicus sp. FF01 TaxID=3397670 RepID=UPI002ACC42CF|nr:hypothetical protein YTPLAS21_02420 [Candidatus Nitrosocosmicus sp.]
MADSFDSMVFSSSLIIFLAALISIFAYEYLFNKGKGKEFENTIGATKLGRKASKVKTKQQFDKVE